MGLFFYLYPFTKVCSGDTNHAEALEVTFDPKRVSYASLVEFFYRMHDASMLNYQGPDVGTQYRSAIFYHSPEQKQVAEEVTQQVQEKHYKSKKIVTQIVPAVRFYDAEEYHQVNGVGVNSSNEVLFNNHCSMNSSTWKRTQVDMRQVAIIDQSINFN